jgi:hypothetical protein
MRTEGFSAEFDGTSAMAVEWTSSSGWVEPPSMAAVGDAGELKTEYLEGNDEIPHVEHAMLCSRLAIVVAYSRFASGDIVASKEWLIFGIDVIGRLGSSPTLIEKRAALRVLDQALTLAERVGGEQMRSHLASAIQSADRAALDDTLDLPAAVLFMSDYYEYILKNNPGRLRDVHGLDLGNEGRMGELSTEVKRVLTGIANAWSDPNAVAEIQRLAQGFGFPQHSEFVSGFDRVHRETSSIRQKLREILTSDPG